MEEHTYDFHQTFDPETDSALMSLVRVLACYENQPVEELPPINYSVDSEALERVLDCGCGHSSSGGVKVEFEYEGNRVRVSSTGDVWVWESTNRVA